MATKEAVFKSIAAQGVLPLYFNADQTVSVEVLKALYRAGVKVVEYTNRGNAAFNNFQYLVEVRNKEMPDMLLGIGTIKNLEQAQNYLNAGADYLVSPGLIDSVVDYARDKGIFYVPGCMTPSEIIAAENKGIGFIKLFPGDLLGVGFVNSIREIFPEIKFMPTGGVDTSAENLQAWFKAGVAVVGMGSKLVSKKLMDARAYDEIERLTREVLQTIRTIRQS